MNYQLAVENVSLSPQTSTKVSALLSALIEARDESSSCIEPLLTQVVEQLPEKFLRSAEKLLSRKRIDPIRLLNVPEVRLGPLLESQIEKLGPEGSSILSMGHWISRAVLEHLGLCVKKSRLLLRDFHAPSSSPRVLHRDIHPITSFACITNLEAAPTSFVNLSPVLHALTSDEKRLINLDSLWSTPAMNLLEYEIYDAELQRDRRHERHGILIAKSEDPTVLRALEKFHQLVDQFSISVTIEPGQLLMWENSVIYHKACQGKIVPTGNSKYSRIVVFVGGGYMDLHQAIRHGDNNLSHSDFAPS